MSESSGGQLVADHFQKFQKVFAGAMLPLMLLHVLIRCPFLVCVCVNYWVDQGLQTGMPGFVRRHRIRQSDVLVPLAVLVDVVG